jgi:hypothetical protein
MGWPLRSVSPVSEALGVSPGEGAELLAVAEAGRAAHARGQCGTADLGQAGQGAGEPGGVHLLVVALAVGGVGGEFCLDGAQQPDLGGDLGGQAGEVDGGVAGVEVKRCPGGIEPLAGAGAVFGGCARP